MKFSTNIDKCKLFGTTPMYLMEYVSTVSVGNILKRDGYSLITTQTDGFAGTEKNTSAIFDVRIGDNKLGVLTFQSSRKHNGVWTFCVDNRVFYTSFWQMSEVNLNTEDRCSDSISIPENQLLNREYKVPMGNSTLLGQLSQKRLSKKPVTIYPYDRYSAFMFIPLIIDDLRLNLRTITKLEIAFDANVNAGLRLKRIRKDTEAYNLILHGKKVTETERMTGCGLWHNFSRKKLESNPSEYIENYKGLSLKTYSKMNEIADIGKKQYIANWNGFWDRMWRSEVSTKSEDVKDWLNYCEISNDETLYTPCIMQFLYRLSEPDYRLRFWRWQSRRLMRYTRKTDDAKFDVFDVITGNI